MKRILLLVLVSLLPILASAYDAYIDGIYYNFSDSQAIVTYSKLGYKSYSGEVFIPDEVTYNGQNYNVTKIGTYAFYQCSDMTSVIIPTSVIRIGACAFDGCSSLTYVSIPSSVTDIGSHAFHDCREMTSLKIGNGVTSIESHAFGLCESLKTVYCHADTVPSASSEAFSETNVSQITLYVPEALKQTYSTTSPWNQFGKIVSITENELTTNGPQLENSSFEEWSIVNPNSNKALYQPWGEGQTPYWGTGNPGATIVGASNSTYVDEGGRRFANLQSKFIAVKFAAGNIFTGDYIETDGTNGILSFGRPFTAFPTKMRFEYKYKTSPITRTGGDWREPWGEYISKSMYENLKGKPDSCQIYIALGDWEPTTYVSSKGTTYTCPYLIRTRPSTLHLFDLNDPHLIAYGQMTCGDSITNWTTKTIDIQYRNSRTPKYIIVVASSSKYGDYFTGGEGSLLQLDNIELLYKNEPEPIDSIPDNGGTFIAKLPNGVNMEFQVLNKKNKTCCVGSGTRCCIDTKTSEEISIPNRVWGMNVVAIGESAFYGCSDLTSVTIPGSVTTIGYYAFAGCSKLSKVIVPDIAAWCGISFNGSYANPLYCAHHLFSDENTEITDLVIPNSVITIGYSAFSGCSGLTSVTIPNSVTSIGDEAFRGCSGLTSVTIPNSVTSIGGYAFDGCKSLTSITIPNSVITIGYSAFSGCSGLTSVTIPNSIFNIGDRAFYGCYGLTSVTLNSDAIVSGVNRSMKNIFGEQVTDYVIGDSVESIGSNAFYECTNMKSVVIGSNVTNIGMYAFSGCYNISSITIPENVSTIGYYAIPTTTTIYTSVGKSLLALWRVGYLNIKENGSGRELAVPKLSLVKSTVNSLTMSFVNEYNDLKETVKIQGEQVKKGNDGYWFVLKGLDPNTQYHNVASLTLTCDSVSYTENYSFKTKPLTLTTNQPKVVSEGNIIVSAETNLDNEETNIGFEWRRIDWTDDFDSNTSIAYLYEGVMEGYIRSLNSNYLWKYRPFYTSKSGRKYYGEWKGIDPADYSYFEPTVHTYATISVQGNMAEVKGYVMRGTDNVTSQGFMYWSAGSASSRRMANSIPSDAKTIFASGNVMTATLENLEYDTHYCCVAFVKTVENETFYGEVQTFTTNVDPDPDGIKDIKDSKDFNDLKDLKDAGWYDLSGRRIAKPQRGINIIRYTDGTSRKVLMK